MESTSSELIFLKIYKRLFERGKTIHPRGATCIEAENFYYILPPFVRFTNFEARKLNVDYIRNEFLWYLKGDPKDLTIAEHAKLWKELIQSNGTISSNYGQYIFGGMNSQFRNCCRFIEEDKETRRASMVILNSGHLIENVYDIPCTYSINFRIRNDYLNMTVHMRSQDCIYGMSNDVPSFSFVHEMMWQTLRRKYPFLRYGTYFHICDSFHLYQKHYGMFLQLLIGSEYQKVYCPRITGPEEVDFLLMDIHEAKDVPSNFSFSRWLKYGPVSKES